MGTSNDTIRVAVVGASGYGGSEIVRLLSTHPNARVEVATSERSAGNRLRRECPWLDTDLVLQHFQPETLDVDFVFLCQESGFAMKHARPLLDKGMKVIDLSADFRLKEASAYPQWYKHEHCDPELLAEAVYGLPELSDRSQIAGARLLANPGCYPTASALALAPIRELVPTGAVAVIDAKSGVSGAGRSRKETDYLFSELDGGMKAYAMIGHRHTPEIEQSSGVSVRFTPHLIPVPRGLHSTVHVPISDGSNLIERFESFYRDEPFVRVQETPPSSKQVLGSNRCDLFAAFDERTGYATITAVIDNLVKGAAGQAIQNMNLMAGLAEDTGLPRNGVWP